MAKLGLTYPEDIERYLRALRFHQRRSWLHGGEDRIQRLLEAHTITMEKGVADSYYGRGTPLATWLSLLDNPERLARVLEIYIDADSLSTEDQEFLAEIVGDVVPSPA